MQPEHQRRAAELEERERRLAALQEGARRWEEQEQEWKRCKVRAAADDGRYRLTEAEYERAYQLFLKAQAGIMAEEMEEGSPCPVCGSLHHPNRAKLPEEAVTQKEVEEKKKLRDAAGRALDCGLSLEEAQNCVKEVYEGGRPAVNQQEGSDGHD